MDVVGLLYHHLLAVIRTSLQSYRAQVQGSRRSLYGPQQRKYWQTRSWYIGRHVLASQRRSLGGHHQNWTPASWFTLTRHRVTASLTQKHKSDTWRNRATGNFLKMARLRVICREFLTLKRLGVPLSPPHCVSHLPYLVSLLVSPVSRLLYLKSHLLSLVSRVLSPISRLSP